MFCCGCVVLCLFVVVVSRSKAMLGQVLTGSCLHIVSSTVWRKHKFVVRLVVVSDYNKSIIHIKIFGLAQFRFVTQTSISWWTLPFFKSSFCVKAIHNFLWIRRKIHRFIHLLLTSSKSSIKATLLQHQMLPQFCLSAGSIMLSWHVNIRWHKKEN